MRNKAPGQDNQGRLNDRLKAIVERSAQKPSPIPSRSERAAVFKQGTLILPHGERLPVVIKNLSKTGVRVEFIKRCELTDHARLIEPSMGYDRRVRVAWQKGGLAGLEFI